MKTIALAFFGFLPLLLFGRHAKMTGGRTHLSQRVVATSVTPIGQTAGATPFIVNLQLMANVPASVRSIGFTINPKPGSVTRPISATYTADYLESRGYLNLQTGEISLPVFGLYANYSNNVTVTSCFVSGSSQQDIVSIMTPAFIDVCGYSSPNVNQARTNDTTLSYDYILLKSNCGNNQSPAIIDTDGAVRWVGTAGLNTYGSIFFQNSFYIASPPPNSSARTGVTRMELDGTYTFVRDYSNMGVTSSGHHNYDPGKQGILIEVNTTAWEESVIFEIDTSGNVLKTWNLAQIISDEMIAGGDDPTQFVHPAPNDWFHNNAATYRPSDDTLIVSSRENFVIGLDYNTGAIKWILGDANKQWYQFPSLRKYALSLGPNMMPPIGQHSVSITYDDGLLLFDDGMESLNHIPAGTGRTSSTARKYQLDLINKAAIEVWNYPYPLFSPFCSSIYEDGPLNYLIDYSVADSGSTAVLFALNSAGNQVFNYRYTALRNCGFAWNAIPIHLENLLFTGPLTTTFQIQSVSKNENEVSISFPAVKGNTYRLEYKANLTDTDWSMISDYAADCSGLTTLTDSLFGEPARFYRVRQL
jgi:arylsulfate sulfotransferase